MLANLENIAVATELEKFSFHPNSKEGQCQRMFKLAYMLAQVCSKYFKLGFNHTWTEKF